MAAERLRSLRRDESGFMLLEVMVAALILAIGILAVVGVFDSSRRLTTISEKNEVIAHRAELELERIQAMPFAAVALTSTPAHSTDSGDPDFYVSGSPASYRWDQGSSGPRTDQLVVDGTNGQIAHVNTWNDGQSRLSGTIYRYVTQVNDACCSGSNYARRVTIAVTVNSGGGLAKPILLSSIVIDPRAG